MPALPRSSQCTFGDARCTANFAELSGQHALKAFAVDAKLAEGVVDGGRPVDASEQTHPDGVIDIGERDLDHHRSVIVVVGEDALVLEALRLTSHRDEVPPEVFLADD